MNEIKWSSRYRKGDKCDITVGVYGIYHTYGRIKVCLYVGASINVKQRAFRAFKKMFTISENFYLAAICNALDKNKIEIRATAIDCDGDKLGEYERLFTEHFKPILNIGSSYYSQSKANIGINRKKFIEEYKASKIQ